MSAGSGGDRAPAGHHIPHHPGGAQGARQSRLPSLHPHAQCAHLFPGRERYPDSYTNQFIIGGHGLGALF